MRPWWLPPLLLWLAGVNLWAFALMGWDKSRAKRGLRRVPERTLFLSAWLGGAPGALAGMYRFRHKTKHRSFVWGIPAILMLELLLAGAAWWLFVLR